MSNDSPFVAPGNDGSAPLQAPPIEQAPVPAFGAAPSAPPQPGYPATAWPVGYASGVPTVPPQAPGRGLPIAMIALSAAYVLVCLVEIFALMHRVSLANQLINDPTSVTIDQADSADNTVSALTLVAFIVFLGALVVLLVWQRLLRRAFSYPGQYQALLKDSGYMLFRIVWVASIFLSIFLRGNGTFDTPQQVVTHDHEFMAYFGVRAALGVLLVFLSVRLMRAAGRFATSAPALYNPQAVNFPQS